MTNIARPVGEDDLQAWVDGRLTPERAKVVDRPVTREEIVTLLEAAYGG